MANDSAAAKMPAGEDALRRDGQPDAAAGSLRLASVTGVDITLRIAGLGGRSYAFLIDWHIRLVAAMAWIGLGNLLLFGDLLPGTGGGGALIYGVLLPALAIYLLYHPVLEVAMQGRTPGKRIAGLRIVSLEGRVPATGALLVRNLLRMIDSLPALYAVGLVSVVATRQAVRIGDIAAGTLLVYEDAPRPRDGDAVPDAAAERAELARQLLRRWDRLEDAPRRELAYRLLASSTDEAALQHADPAELKERLATLSGADARRQ